MLRTLRNRLILSHILPLLIIIPLTGIIIVYTLETQILLPRLSKELAGEGRLIAEIISQQPEVWNDPNAVQAMLSRTQPELIARVMWLAPDGRLLASSDPGDTDRLGWLLPLPDLSSTPSGEVVAYVDFSQRLQSDIVDVYAPVISSDHRLAGIVRLSYRFDNVYEDFFNLRYFIAAILIVSLLAGVGLGSILALNINTPLQQVIDAVYELARGSRSTAIIEQGPEEIRLLQRSVNHLVERLHSLEEGRRRLLANLVHEIGRPLGALHAAIQALLRIPQPEPQMVQEMLAGMNDETNRLQSLLEELTHLHDLVLGTLELEHQPINLGEWLPAVLRPWEAAAEEKRLKWKISIPPYLPTLLADPLRLAQVIGNLISNAVKYTLPGGTVAIDVGSDGENTWFRVSDTGPGIYAEELEKIFTPFYRGAQGGRISQGMGLGLTIARDLVTAHQGRLEVKSQPGLGSQFTVWLPNTSPYPQEEQRISS